MAGANERQPSGGEAAAADDGGLGGFGDFFAFEEPQAATPSQPADDAAQQGVTKEAVGVAQQLLKCSQQRHIPSQLRASSCSVSAPVTRHCVTISGDGR